MQKYPTSYPEQVLSPFTHVRPVIFFILVLLYFLPTQCNGPCDQLERMCDTLK